MATPRVQIVRTPVVGVKDAADELLCRFSSPDATRRTGPLY
jgi:hypothetical protein